MSPWWFELDGYLDNPIFVMSVGIENIQIGTEKWHALQSAFPIYIKEPLVPVKRFKVHHILTDFESSVKKKWLIDIHLLQILK